MDYTAAIIKLSTGSEDDTAEAVRALLSLEITAGVFDDSRWVDVRVNANGLECRLLSRSCIVTRETFLSHAEAENSLFAAVATRLFPELDFGTNLQRKHLDEQAFAVQRGQPRISIAPHDTVQSSAFDKFATLRKSQRMIGVVGPSASGKSVLLSSCLAREFDRLRLVWVDLADPTVGVLGLLLTLLRRDSDLDDMCVVLDDVQSSPVVADTMLSLRSSFTDRGLAWIASGWPSAREVIAKHVGASALVSTDPAELCRRIVQPVISASADREEVYHLAAGDALVAQIAARAYREMGRPASLSAISEMIYNLLLDNAHLGPGDLETLRKIACLGMFEIDVQESFLSPREVSATERLTGGGICRRNSGYVYFGHRTVARMLVHHIDRNGLVSERTSPVRLAVEYLRSAGPGQIKITLDRLDLLSMAGSDDQFGAAFLAECWTALGVLSRHLSQQVVEDPTWGDNVASAVFAGEAFAELGMLDEWRLCASYVRGRWVVEDGASLPSHTHGHTAESDDFATIRERMIAEDEIEIVDGWLPAGDVDIDRFHRTWVLGLLLGFEGKSLEPDPERLERLLEMATKSLSAEGSFYPPRVPWVTGRVLLGLAGCGLTVHSSEVANHAARWLRTRPPIGPARIGGVWRSGTGSWNTDLQITALVLLSLGRVGVDPSDRVVGSGLQFLRSGRPEWYRPGKEIDAAQAVEAALVLGGSWRDYEPELRSLLQWCQDSRSWALTRALASVTQDESSKVPAVASALIAVIWETVKSELPLLLQGIAGDGDSGEDADLDAQLVRCERALLALREQIEGEVQSRQQIVARGRVAQPIRDQFELWRERQTTLERLRHQHGRIRVHMNPAALDELIEELDRLGTEVQGTAWRGLRE